MSLILQDASAALFLTRAVWEFIHASRTSGDFAALLHTFKLASATTLRLAHHVVIIVVLATRPNEEGGTEQRRRTGSELFDLGDVVG
jgi:hypothetical protein